MNICQGRVKAFVGVNTDQNLQIVMICEKFPYEIECECCNDVKSSTVVLTNEDKDWQSSFKLCERDILRQLPHGTYYIKWDKELSEIKTNNYASIMYGTIKSLR